MEGGGDGTNGRGRGRREREGRIFPSEVKKWGGNGLHSRLEGFRAVNSPFVLVNETIRPTDCRICFDSIKMQHETPRFGDRSGKLEKAKRNKSNLRGLLSSLGLDRHAASA